MQTFTILTPAAADQIRAFQGHGPETRPAAAIMTQSEAEQFEAFHGHPPGIHAAAAILPASRVAEIAAFYGLDPDSRLVAENAEGARAAHGREVPGYNGDGRLYWNVDPRTRRVDAELQLHGWLKEEARCMGADCAEVDRFHRDAYGED